MQEPRRKLDEYGPQEMAIPEYRLLQKTGGDLAKEQGGQPGQFYNTLLGEVVDELNIVIVDILSGRARWGAEIKNVGPVCACLDVKSDKSEKSIYGNNCNECEYRMDAPWSLEATERRKMCCLNYTILGIDLDHDYMPIMLRAHGVSALPARQLITQLKMNRTLRGEYHKAIINIKSAEKDTAYGTTYSLRPKIVELITDEIKVEELRVESLRLLGTPIPLPEGRPEEEGEPLGYTPLGTPFFSKEEREVIMVQETQVAEPVEKQPPSIEQTIEEEQPAEGEPPASISPQSFKNWGELAEAARKLGVSPTQVFNRARVKKWEDLGNFTAAWEIVEELTTKKVEKPPQGKTAPLTKKVEKSAEKKSELDLNF